MHRIFIACYYLGLRGNLGIVDAVLCMTCVGGDGRLALLRTSEFADNPSQPFHFFTLNGLKWIDWVGVIGVIVTIIGFGITWWQLHRTKTARQAVTEFITTSNREMANSRMTKTLNSLLVQHNKANDAVAQNDRIALQKALEKWTRSCSQVISQLGRAQAVPNGSQAYRQSHQEADRITENKNQFLAARVTVDEALLKLRSSSLQKRLSTEIVYAIGKMHECSNLAVTILEEDQYRKVS